MTQNQVAYKNAAELERHNKAVEAETTRHQQMQEQLSRWANALQNYQIAVNQAHYQRMDAETERANKAREGQNLLTLQENMRSNVANEYIREQANRISSASVAETSRHQKALESLQEQLNASQISRNLAEVSYTSANTGYIQERTKSEGVYRTIIMPGQAALNESQRFKNVEEADTQSTVRFRNVMSGFSDAINATSNAFRSITSVVSPLQSEGDVVRRSFQQLLK